MSTSGCTPRAIRVHAVQVPQASLVLSVPPRPSDSPEAVIGVRQLSDCATATAMSRIPAPAGPEKIKLGGSASRATDLASNAASLRWPHRLTTSPNGMRPSLSFLSVRYTSLVRSAGLQACDHGRPKVCATYWSQL